ncbi:MAG: response regulator transcription factor [Bacteroidota bacterium]
MIIEPENVLTIPDIDPICQLNSNEHYNTPLFLLGNQFFYVQNYPDKSICFVHPNVRQVLEYSEEIFNTELISDIIHPEDKEPVNNVMHKIEHWVDRENIAPMTFTVAMHFRVKKNSGKYTGILCQSSVYSNDRRKKHLTLIHFCSEISTSLTTGHVSVSCMGNHASLIEKELKKSCRNDENKVLSEREKEIVKYLIQGMSSQEISHVLCISKNTVDTHRRNMLKKLKMKNTCSLIGYFWDNHFVT